MNKLEMLGYLESRIAEVLEDIGSYRMFTADPKEICEEVAYNASMDIELKDKDVFAEVKDEFLRMVEQEVMAGIREEQ